MYPDQLTNATYRKDRLRDAERQRLIDFVTCCTRASWFRRLSSGVLRLALLLRQTACDSCAA